MIFLPSFSVRAAVTAAARTLKSKFRISWPFSFSLICDLSVRFLAVAFILKATSAIVTPLRFGVTNSSTGLGSTITTAGTSSWMLAVASAVPSGVVAFTTKVFFPFFRVTPADRFPPLSRVNPVTDVPFRVTCTFLSLKTLVTLAVSVKAGLSVMLRVPFGLRMVTTGGWAFIKRTRTEASSEPASVLALTRIVLFPST